MKELDRNQIEREGIAPTLPRLPAPGEEIVGSSVGASAEEPTQRGRERGEGRGGEGGAGTISEEEGRAIRERALEILRREVPAAEVGSPEVEKGLATKEHKGHKDSAAAGSPAGIEPIPARMLNEFVYCRRLFYYEYVEGIFVESADTLRGAAIHKRVDSGSGALPPATKPKRQ